jgi:hypothetical protein
MIRRHLLLLLALAGLFTAATAHARVTITFWSHDLGHYFPHAFITLRGVPDAGGPAIDRSYGFTVRSVSPAILLGSVAGRLETETPDYIDTSDARFSVILTDAQYARILTLAAAWDSKTGDSRYDLNARNCVHFVKEAARIAGLTGLDQPRLMKKPRSYLLAVAAANPAAVTVIDLPGKAYLATPSRPAISIRSSVDSNPG